MGAALLLDVVKEDKSLSPRRSLAMRNGKTSVSAQSVKTPFPLVRHNGRGVLVCDLTRRIAQRGGSLLSAAKMHRVTRWMPSSSPLPSSMPLLWSPQATPRTCSAWLHHTAMCASSLSEAHSDARSNQRLQQTSLPSPLKRRIVGRAHPGKSRARIRTRRPCRVRRHEHGG